MKWFERACKRARMVNLDSMVADAMVEGAIAKANREKNAGRLEHLVGLTRALLVADFAPDDAVNRAEEILSELEEKAKC